MASRVTARDLGNAVLGRLVQYELNGEVVFWGIAEYLTADGWVGIRQTGGRLDEALAKLTYPDPT